MTTHWTKFVNWGNKLNLMAGSLHLLASTKVGVTIHKQWIRDLRHIADEMEMHMKGEESHGSKSTTKV
jgi:hypothetical protein